MLKLRSFRNLANQELHFPPEGVAIVAPNARGKSNLLEAVYYLETFRSFRGARDTQLIGFGEDAFHVSGSVVDGGESVVQGEVTAAFQRSGRRKKVTVDGQQPERLAGGLGHLASVMFSPADIALVNGGPGVRRRFLDIVLSLNSPGYLDALQRYRHGLAQRNAALKAGQPRDAVRTWNDALVKNGALVMAGRAAWVERWAGSFSEYHSSISDGELAVMAYAPSVDCAHLPDTAMEEALSTALDEAAEREVRQRTTVVGPHRDELRLSLEGDRALDLRDFGSGGQQRTAALALRLVEVDTIRECRHTEPILLLDDVFAELDEARSERILELMEGAHSGQVILTAPKETDVRLGHNALPRWGIEQGRVAAS